MDNSERTQEIEFNRLYFEDESKKSQKELKKKFIEHANNAPETTQEKLVFPWSKESLGYSNNAINSPFKPTKISKEDIELVLDGLKEIHYYDAAKIKPVSKKKCFVFVAIMSAICMVGLISIPQYALAWYITGSIIQLVSLISVLAVLKFFPLTDNGQAHFDFAVRYVDLYDQVEYWNDYSSFKKFNCIWTVGDYGAWVELKIDEELQEFEIELTRNTDFSFGNSDQKAINPQKQRDSEKSTANNTTVVSLEDKEYNQHYSPQKHDKINTDIKNSPQKPMIENKYQQKKPLDQAESSFSDNLRVMTPNQVKKSSQKNQISGSTDPKNEKQDVHDKINKDIKNSAQKPMVENKYQQKKPLDQAESSLTDNLGVNKISQVKKSSQKNQTSGSTDPKNENQDIFVKPRSENPSEINSKYDEESGTISRPVSNDLMSEKEKAIKNKQKFESFDNQPNSPDDTIRTQKLNEQVAPVSKNPKAHMTGTEEHHEPDTPVLGENYISNQHRDSLGDMMAEGGILSMKGYDLNFVPELTVEKKQEVEPDWESAIDNQFSEPVPNDPTPSNDRKTIEHMIQQSIMSDMEAGLSPVKLSDPNLKGFIESPNPTKSPNFSREASFGLSHSDADNTQDLSDNKVHFDKVHIDNNLLASNYLKKEPKSEKRIKTAEFMHENKPGFDDSKMKKRPPSAKTPNEITVDNYPIARIDKCNLEFDDKVTKTLEEKEFLVWSGEVKKTNRRNQIQERNFVMTTKKLMNFGDDGLFSFLKADPDDRAVDMKLLNEVTCCNYYEGLVLHVNDDKEKDVCLIFNDIQDRNDFLQRLILNRELLCKEKTKIYVSPKSDIRQYCRYKKTKKAMQTKLDTWKLLTYKEGKSFLKYT